MYVYESGYWDISEASSFLEFANVKYNNPDICDGKHGRQYYIAYLLALNAAPRSGEIWGLKPMDIVKSDIEKGAALQIRRQFNSKLKAFTQLKGAGLSRISKNRTAPCPIALESELLAHIRHNRILPDQTIFQGKNSKPITHRLLSYRFKKDLIEWGGRKIRFHDLRHTAGTLMIESVDVKTVQKILGHAQLATTDGYLHSRDIRGVSKTHSVLPTAPPPTLKVVGGE